MNQIDDMLEEESDSDEDKSPPPAGTEEEAFDLDDIGEDD